MLTDDYCPRDGILVVDDDDMQRELLCNALDDLGMPVYEAADGSAALETFRNHHPLLVVMDINMPVMDGYEACAKIREFAGGDGAAIILVTALDDLQAVQKAFDAGAIEFLTKPFDWPLLRMRVQYILRIQQTYLQVQEQLEELAWAQQAAGVGSWEYDPQKGEFCLSPKSARSGQPSHCYTMQRLQKVVYPGDWKPLTDAFAALLAEGTPLDMDIRMTLAHDQVIFTHVYAEQRSIGTDRRITISGTIQDVTDRKLAEEKIKEASAMKDQFLANMSHELRTPINGVLGMVDLLETTTLNAEQTEWSRYIRKSARHLLTVLNDVLDFSALETDQTRIRIQTFHLHHCLAGVEKMVQAMTGAKNLEIVFEIANETPEEVVGDEGRLRQVLLNLIGNAVKFTPSGQVTISVRPCHDHARPDRLRFAVTDTGVGIPLEKQARVFNQFFQVDGSLTRKHEGTGLGLAISKRLVELMGGDIQLQSTEGQGTSICFQLPLAAVSPADTPETVCHSDEEPEITNPSRIRILLVEDNKINQVFAKAILDKQGFQVDVANNGQEAVAMVRRHDFEFVLMDCQMPIMDGYQATRRIRELGGRFADLPIVALTAHALEGDREKCLAAGMDDYLTKPASGKDLARCILKMVEPQTLLNG